MTPKRIGDRQTTEHDKSVHHRWRTGRKLGRTLYEQQGHRPSDDDAFLGIMETRELAAHVAALHNERIA